MAKKKTGSTPKENTAALVVLSEVWQSPTLCAGVNV